MNSLVEDRLRDALAARAEQVTPEDLRPLVVGSPQHHRRRAVVLAGLAAAAAVAALLVAPMLSDGSTEPQPVSPSPTPTPSPSAGATADPQARDQLAVDVDVDGEDDLVRVVGADLEVALASGTTATFSVGEGAQLLPWVDLGTTGPGLVVVPPPGVEEGGAVVAWIDDTLAQVDTPGLLVQRPGRVVWVDDIRGLHSGEYDAAVSEDQRVLVQATSYYWVRGKLRSNPAGNECWDRIAQDTPVICDQLPEQDADPSLMFPVIQERFGVGERHGDFRDAYNEIVLREAGDGYELSYTWDAVTTIAPVPTEVAPELLGGAISSSMDAPAFVVAYPDGDVTAMGVFAPTSDLGFRALETQDGRFLGDTTAGDLEQRTWISENAGLWTARQVSPADPQLWAVTRWSVEDNELVADDQGQACLDLDAGRRLPDATCGAS